MERENKLASRVLDCAFTVHRNLGPGLLESAYQMAMEAELFENSIPFISQTEVPLEYKERSISTTYRLDFLVDDHLNCRIESS